MGSVSLHCGFMYVCMYVLHVSVSLQAQVAERKGRPAWTVVEV